MILSSLPAMAANDCADGSGDVAIAACTSRIDSGKFRGHDQAENYYNRGIEYKNKGDNDRAIADYNQALRLDPKYANGYNNRGNSYDNKGDYDRAISDYNQALRLDPKLAKAYSNRGSSYDHKGDHDRAIADYNQSLSLDPKYANAYNNRGNAYDSKGDYDRAIADYSQAINLDPKYVAAYNNRGVSYDNKGDYDRAIADFNQAINLDPKISNAYGGRGRVYRHKGDHDRAIADMTQAISLDPKKASYYDSRADVYGGKGDYGQAIVDYTQAIDLGNKSSYFGRGRANFYAGLKDKALADLNQASALAPTYAYIALWIEIVRQRSGLPGNLSQTSSQIDMTAWPAPIVKLLAGQITADAALAAANDPDASKKKGQVCETNFYAGELSLLRGSKGEAIRLFRLAASDCPRGFLEWAAANAELKALGETSGPSVSSRIVNGISGLFGGAKPEQKPAEPKQQP